MPSHWIRSRTWDSFWLLSGFWIPTFILLLPIDKIKPLTVVVTLLFWMGHRISSLYLGFCVGEYREVLQARRHYFLSFPLVLLCLLAAFLLLAVTNNPVAFLVFPAWVVLVSVFLLRHSAASRSLPDRTPDTTRPTLGGATPS